MSIISDNIEHITYGGINIPSITEGLKINCKSLREIDLNIPNLSGELDIDENCISLRKINIANSGLYGTFSGFPNLQEVNISGLKADKQSISVSGSDFLSGENFKISGSDKDNKTTLNSLSISGVVGNFNCVNTNISSINIQNNTKLNGENFDSSKLSEFSISNDEELVELRLTGFRKVSITSCKNLNKLIIDDALEEIYINLEKHEKDETESKLKKIFLSTECEDGVFDFTNYPNLKRVTLINCYNLVHVKLPDHDIETDGMSDNINLEWIDTGTLPAFSDTREYPGESDYEGKTFPSYNSGPKLILCSSEVFRNCPKYSMLRRDYDGVYDSSGNKSSWNDFVNGDVEGMTSYTNVIVSEECTSLKNTFYVDSRLIDSNEDKFDMETAIRFIEKCVRNKENITTLYGCFNGRQKVVYSMNDAKNENSKGHHKHPSLNNYTSLSDISYMYYNTGVNFISKKLLDLPENKNTSDNTLLWDNFIQGMRQQINVSDDALYNISYRLKSYSNIGFTIYKYDDVEKKYKIAGEEIILEDGEKQINYFDICDFFYHRYENNDGKGRIQ
jgi:hypothetical protein